MPCPETGAHAVGMPREREDKDGGDALISQGKPHIVSRLVGAGRETWNKHPLRPSEGNQPSNTLILDFWPLALRQTSVV